MKILGIDSTSKKLSVAVNIDNSLLCEIYSNTNSKHMVDMISLIDESLKKSDLTLKDIDIFGINLGPGDFTGTRIGLSIVKILSIMEDKTAYGINSLDIFSTMIVFGNKKIISKKILSDMPVLIMPCLDVKKSEIYFSFYKIIPEGNFKNGKIKNNCIALTDIGGRDYLIKRITDYMLVKKDNLIYELTEFFTEDDYKKYSDPLIIIGGNALESYKNTVFELKRLSKNIIFDKKCIYPSARYVNICSYFNAAAKIKPKTLIPVYVREFIPFGS